MWFMSRSKARRQLFPGRPRERFCPRLETLEDRCLMSAGALDTSFGTRGLVSEPLGAPYPSTGFTLQTDSWWEVPVVVYPNTGQHSLPSVPASDATDNKILAGGFVPDPISHYQDFAIARYNSDGTLDTAFGNGGVAYTSVGVSSSDLFALAIDVNRDIVAVGAAASQRIKSGSGKNATTVDDEAIAIVRFTPAGVLDTSFNSAGSKPGTMVINVTTPVIQRGVVTGGADYATAVALDVSGNIVVGGTSNGTSKTNFTLVRLTSAGSLDSTFGRGGIVITPNIGNTSNFAGALTIQADGKILLAGSAGSSGMVARFNATNGSLDGSFGSGGIVSGLLPSAYRASEVYGVLVQSNGAIVLAGTSSDSVNVHLTLARLTSTGQLDTVFGGTLPGYYISPNLSYALSLVQAPNGDLLTGGTYGDPFVFGVSAFLPGGTPDTTFGNNGTSTTPGLVGGQARGRGIALQSDGKIVLAGFTASTSSSTDYTLGLARFLPPNTKVGSFTGSSSAADHSVTLTASNILNSNPTSPVTQVYFYLQNPDLSLTLLGSATTSINGAWSITFSEDAYGLAPGNTYTFVAQAADSSVPAVLSDPVTVSLQVV